MSMPWSELKQFVNFFPKKQFPESLLPLNGDLLMYSEQVFYLVVPRDRRCAVTADSPFLTCLIWAQSTGAAQRAMNGAIEKDQEVNTHLPPLDLLPKECVMTYGDLVRTLKIISPESLMETATYRIATDGAFIHKTISARLGDGKYQYHFRRPKILAEELPYAISFSGP